MTEENPHEYWGKRYNSLFKRSIQEIKDTINAPQSRRYVDYALLQELADRISELLSMPPDEG